MPIKVESYQSADGKFHATEIAAVRHEVLTALWQAVPELKDRKLLIENNIDRISEILQPLAALQPKNHPDPSAETTLEPEDRGGCDCSANMAGNGGEHHPTCPLFRGRLLPFDSSASYRPGGVNEPRVARA